MQRKRIPLANRFWPKVDTSAGVLECWPWRGYITSRGYGRADFDQQNRLTHRIAWELTNGPIAAGMRICHSCDNPPCCNPAHLFLGTQGDNVADMMAKGRHRGLHGSASPRAKINEETVRALRRRHKEGETFASLAREVGLTKTSVRQTVLGQRWAHLSDD